MTGKLENENSNSVNLAPQCIFLITIIGISSTYRLQSNRKKKLWGKECN